MTTEIIEYETTGTCCALIQLKINDGIIEDALFHGGCNGNLKGLRNLIIGMNIEDVITKLNGIKCNNKATSCPDQLAQCLIAYKNKETQSV